MGLGKVLIMKRYVGMLIPYKLKRGTLQLPYT